MGREVVDGQKVDIKRKLRYPKLEFDRLQMYFGKPYIIDLEGVNGSITIKMPTVGNVMMYGEKLFNATLSIFITNTTSYRLALWDSGIDWNEISDFELFCMLYKKLDNGAVNLMFDNLDFSKFELNKVMKDDVEQIVLYDKEDDIEINEDVYQYIHQYLQEVFNIFPVEKITHNKTMKEMYIRKDRSEFEHTKEDSEKSSIQALISSCVNHPGFKYKLNELTDLGMCEFYDSVKRLQIYESSTALMKGMYSGFVDSSKIKPDSYNFMKEI